MEPSDSDPQRLRPRRRPVTLNPMANLRYWMDDRLPPVLWQGQLRPAFWKGATLLSLGVNLALIVTVLALGRHVFELKRIVEPLITGLQGGFAQMDSAHIETDVGVQDQVPVTFDLPVKQDTVVTLTEPTRIEGASVAIQTGAFTVNAPAVVVLPEGTRLPIKLDMTVPVEVEVPINFDVPVDIPLGETELHQPFDEMGGLIGGYRQIIEKFPDCWNEFLWGAKCR